MINKIYEKIKNFIVSNYKFLIAILIIILLFYVELPYLIYKSGGTVDLSDRVKTELNYKSDGTLSMSYVSVVKGAPAYILLSYILPDWDLMSIKEEYGDTDYKDAIKSAKESMNEGIDYAIIAAFKESKYSVTINDTKLVVNSILTDSKTNLEIGDEIVSINDIEIKSQEDVINVLKNLKENDKVTIKVINDGKKYNRSAQLINTVDGLKMGIIIGLKYDYETEIPVEIKMRNKESGSSGGLMMALAIYNSLTKKDISHGKNIVGTGTIDIEGNVGEIDGIKYKLLGAKKKHADIFFVPTENYKEALEVKRERNLKIEIVAVKTLKDAIKYLDNY